MASFPSALPSIASNFELTPCRCIIPNELVVLMTLKRNNANCINRRAQRSIAVPKRRLPLIRFMKRLDGLLDLLDYRKPQHRIPGAVASIGTGAADLIAAAKPAALPAWERRSCLKVSFYGNRLTLAALSVGPTVTLMARHLWGRRPVRKNVSSAAPDD